MNNMAGISLRRNIGNGFLRKVPEITVYFWVIKLLTTALGESTSDYLVNQFNPYAVVMLGFTVFIIAMVIQLRTRRYVAWIYWLAVTMVAIFGTMAADVAHIALGIPYIISAIGFALALAIIFVLWQKTEGTLSIHSINTPRRELFYWATVLATFALGTAVGDLSAYTFKLGFLSSGIIFAVVFLAPAIGFKVFRWNAIFAFWFAYIMTRPLGASFADWTGKAHSFGGLGIGDGPMMILLSFLIICFVTYDTIARKDEPIDKDFA